MEQGSRVQRRIEALLDEADEAVTAEDWETVAARARAALVADPGNGDARAYLEMAERGLRSATSPAAVGSTTPSSTAQPHPESFANGRYEVRRFVGEGGKKRVFLAHDEVLDRDVAFALIKTEGLDATGRERIVREAQAMGRLGSHPHVVSIFDIGEHEGTPYVVTELMGGGDVEGTLQEAGGPLPLKDALRIASEVARGLVFAHGKQVIHRDLKPGNVWLTENGTAKIGDFGLAVSLDRTRLTQHGMMVGTVAYMPPEQALGGEVTPQADLYALGAMLYEMVTGSPPFQGSDPTAVISQHINTQPVAPSWNSEFCPTDLEELIMRLLAKAPRDRPASAEEVLDVLGRVDPEAKSATHSGSANPLDRLARGVFVGRERELEKLRSAFDEAFAGRGSVVMLVGEPGIGKTRTTQELETYAHMRGAHVFWGRTHESAGAPPYWPWVQVGSAWGAAVDLLGSGGDALLSGGSLTPGTSELVRLFPALRQLPGFVEPETSPEPETAQFRLFDAYATFMRARSVDRPWLVILDDIHWADKPTLQLLQFVARELANMRVLVVGTYRDTELSRTHPLSEALAKLNRESGFLRLPLRGLTRDEVGEYIRQRAAKEPPRAVVDRIYEETEGNAFFLSEVVNLMAEEGTLERDSLSDIALPEGVREALGRRLDRLSEEANELLQVCAVVGREFTYETLTLLSERSADDLLRLIEESLNARVIEESETPGNYRFTHALMQETLLEELSTTRRVRLHGQVGEALEKRYGANSDARAPRLALHFLESATLAPAHARKAAHYSKVAGEQAEEELAWAEAQRHYENCLGLVTESDDRLGQDEAALSHALGRVAYKTGDLRTGWTMLASAIELYRERGDLWEMADATLMATNVQAPRAERLRILNSALESIGADMYPELSAQLLIRRASIQGIVARAKDRDAAATIAERLNLPDVRAELDRLDARTLADEGRWTGAASLAQQAHQYYGRVGASLQASLAGMYWGMYLFSAGQVDAAESALTEAIAYARGAQLSVEHQIAGSLAALYVMQGRLEEARALAEKTPPGYRIRERLLLAEFTGSEAPPPPPMESVEGWEFLVHGLHALRAWWFALRHEDELARQELDNHLRTFPLPAAVGDRIFWLHYVNAWRAIERVGTAEHLKRWRDIYDQEPVLPELTTAGCLSRFRGVLAMRTGDLDEAAMFFDKAVALCEREGLVIELAITLMGLAELHERQGQHDSAMDELDRAGDLFARNGATRLLDQVIAKKGLLKA